MTTVTRGTGRHQPGESGTENALIGALVLIAVLAIGALAYIVRLSGEDVGSVAPVAIPTIGAIGSAAIGGIVVVLRRRPPRRRT
ncbi:hypothetical protein [Micromonospora rubida]|uniref:hypothetical protein n=1 Tax=Micromonospora rubida TaxID=2697657 RepID=UPI001377216A|nr:hypothetical protein [Micromonospora rubida]NBE84580.1 hypothetical protein [Micromonospora rubida]